VRRRRARRLLRFPRGARRLGGGFVETRASLVEREGVLGAQPVGLREDAAFGLRRLGAGGVEIPSKRRFARVARAARVFQKSARRRGVRRLEPGAQRLLLERGGFGGAGNGGGGIAAGGGELLRRRLPRRPKLRLGIPRRQLGGGARFLQAPLQRRDGVARRLERRGLRRRARLGGGEFVRALSERFVASLGVFRRRRQSVARLSARRTPPRRLPFRLVPRLGGGLRWRLSRP
jgi:hypothetical protein